MLGLTVSELHLFKCLTALAKIRYIQNYLDKILMNWDDSGHYLSPRQVMREERAHCLEEALFATAALWVHDEKPLIMDMLAEKNDEDYVLALYKRGSHWGVISKTNHATIRFRDPVYRTVRELVMSYFHEWFKNSRTARKHSGATPLP